MTTTGGKGTILIVEDEAGFRRIYHDLLEHEGYTVLEAEDGEKGWELAQQNPDLILLDLVLPKLHGFEVLQNIRANETTKDIPIIIFSVMGEKANIQKGLELGANDFAVKGFYAPRDILTKIRALLAKADVKRNIGSYHISINEGRGDAAKLQQDIGLTKLFDCPQCGNIILLELLPDYTRTQGNWFSAHFVCPKCGKNF